MIDNVIFSLRQKGEQMKASNQISSGNSYVDAARSFERFHGKRNALRFSSITAAFMAGYETFMLTEGRLFKGQKKGTPASTATVGIYCRNLRAVYNDAIAAKIVKADSSPFGSEYTIPSSTATRTPIDHSVVKQILAFECVNDTQRLARDFWVFSYFCNGMNTVDMLNLKVRDIDVVNMTFSFEREKTKRSAKPVLIQGSIFPDSLDVIQRRGNVNQKPDEFLFPFLKKAMTPAEQKARKDYFVKQINRGMKSIGASLGLSCDLNSYVARHSFCSTLVHSGAPMAFVAQAMGHRKVSTTEGYVGRFPVDKSKSYLAVLGS